MQTKVQAEAHHLCDLWKHLGWEECFEQIVSHMDSQCEWPIDEIEQVAEAVCVAQWGYA